MRTRDAGASGCMGKITGFLEMDRNERKYASVAERVQHYREFVIPLSEKDTKDQAARCMNCGIPYCHGTGSVAPGTPGCPVNNQIPDFNDLVYQNNWEEASRNLHSTNNFPEFTGRICPAPCEASCTLNIDDNPVTIKTIECAIVDRGWEEGWIVPQMPARRTGKRVAVIGSGPAGMACAQQLARAGHAVTPRAKHVVVIGGGDTGSDCIGTSTRQGAASITQLEILPRPPDHENKALVWPDWPLKLRTSSSQEEGCERDWAVLTKRALGSNGRVEALECVRVEWLQGPDGRWAMQEVPNSAFELKADLVLLAMGFLGPRRTGMLDQAGVKLDPRGNVAASTLDYQTSAPKIFAAGDMRRGQSLVAWAIREGRQCARAVDEFLKGSSLLPQQRPAT